MKVLSIIGSFFLTSTLLGAELQPFASGLERPVKLAIAPGDTSFVYVLEQTGQILQIDQQGQIQPFLNIADRVDLSGNEAGLLGLAFHPNYEANGRLFVNYTADGGEGFHTRVSEFLRNDPSSENILMRVPQPFRNHNGGEVEFGPDGYLYISLGDGGAGGDPQGHGQNLRTLLGSILRIDVDTDEAPYSIPDDNPFVDSPSAKPEIYAYGLRNPWRFSFDLTTNQLWTGDVGQNAFEEINLIEKGGNYGWKIMEGRACYRARTCNQSGLKMPVVDYPRSEGISVTGGYVYRGQAMPELVGKYIYGDFGSGKIWAFSDRSEVIVESGRNVAAFGQDWANELYVLDLDGDILKLVPAR